MTPAVIVLAAYGLMPNPGETPSALPDAPSAKPPTADTSAGSDDRSIEAPARDAAPRLGLLDSAYGLEQGAAFAGATGAGLWANHTVQSDAGDKSSAAYGGGVLLGFSPLTRLTLSAVIGRDAGGRWSPSATTHLRIFGNYADGGALGALARYKTEGFTELGGEVEAGFTGGIHTGRFVLNANLVGGTGVEAQDGGELDVEGLLAVGYDASTFVRVGSEGRVRRRVSGSVQLAGGRSTDALAGPTLTFTLGPVLVFASGGASTVHVASGVGGYGTLTVATVVK